MHNATVLQNNQLQNATLFILTADCQVCLMQRMDTIFDIWPTAAAMARDIGTSPINVRSWKNRKSIPAKYDTKIIAAAKALKVKVTYEQLAKLRAG